MCQISFKIQYTDADGDQIQAAEGRYKLKSATTFQPVFNINISNPQTPDINVNGVYDLEVRVQDRKGMWSDWYASSFKVSENCNPDMQYVILEGNCETSLSNAVDDVTNVWIDITNGADPDALDGLDKVYMNEEKTILFASGGTTTEYRIGQKKGGSAILWFDKVFKFGNEQGVISSVRSCSGGVTGGGQITTPAIHTGCDSGMVVTVKVPDGETRIISVIKSGQANYIGGNQSGITADVMVGADISNQVIDKTTSYGLVLDAEGPGNGLGQSSITLNIEGEGSFQLRRTHQSNPNFC